MDDFDDIQIDEFEPEDFDPIIDEDYGYEQPFRFKEDLPF